MPALRRKNPSKISLRQNTLHDEEDDETCEVPAKQLKQQQQLVSSPPITPASTKKDNLCHNSPPATPTTPYKPCDFVRRRSAAAAPHTHSDSDREIFSSTYRKDAPFKSIIVNILLVRKQEYLKLKAYPDDTIDFLKLQIETKGWIPAERQRLTYKGKLLEHASFQLSMYDIVDQAGLICHEA